MSDDIAALQSRLDATRIALDEAIVDRLVSEPWRISDALYGRPCWPPPVSLDQLTDALLFAELECRWRIRLWGYRHHPQVHRIELCVDALLKMLCEDA